MSKDEMCKNCSEECNINKEVIDICYDTNFGLTSPRFAVGLGVTTSVVMFLLYLMEGMI